MTAKTILITGGTKGLGKGIAEYFLRAGNTVVIGARSAPSAAIEAEGNTALFQECDVRDPQQTQNLVDYCVAETGRVDVLINNAGGSPEVDSGDVSARFTQAIINLNLTGPAVLSQQAYQAMRATGGGCIINIASVSAQRPSPGTSAYGAAKAGLVNLTRSLAQEWAPNVRVNVIIAGLAKTDAALDHYGGEDGIKKIEQRMPMQRMAVAEDIAKACAYLMSAQADYVSGATLEVHGGGEPPAFLSLQA